MQGPNPGSNLNTPLLSRAASSPRPSQDPVRNAELRTILLNLKAGNTLPEVLISRFLDITLPLKQHNLQPRQTTDQAVLLVALTHLIRGSLGVSESEYTHSPKTSPADPKNTSRNNAERVLGKNLAAFKTALTVKLEAYASKGTANIACAVGLVAGVLGTFQSAISPASMISESVADISGTNPKDELGLGKSKKLSLHNIGHRMLVMERNVRWAIKELKADIQSQPK